MAYSDKRIVGGEMRPAVGASPVAHDVLPSALLGEESVIALCDHCWHVESILREPSIDERLINLWWLDIGGRHFSHRS